MLDDTSNRLRMQNREAMEHITKPINENFEQLQKAIQESDRERRNRRPHKEEHVHFIGL